MLRRWVRRDGPAGRPLDCCGARLRRVRGCAGHACGAWLRDPRSAGVEPEAATRLGSAVWSSTPRPLAAARPLALGAPTLSTRSSSPRPGGPTSRAAQPRRRRLAHLGRVRRARRAIAAGLDALGVKRGDTVGLMMLNRPEFPLVDTAALHLGATPFSVYNTSPPEQIAHEFANAGNRVVISEAHFAGRARARRRPWSTSCSSTAQGTPCRSPSWSSRARPVRLRPSVAGGRARGRATVIYTSGTTGPPKGVELTHANALAECARRGAPPAAPGGRACPTCPRRTSSTAGPATTGLAHARLHGHRRSTTRDGAPPAPRPRPTVGRRAADLGEAPGTRSRARASPSRRRSQEARRRAAGAARARRRAPRRRRGAGPDRRAGVLRRPRPAVDEVWGMSEPPAPGPRTRRARIRHGTVRARAGGRRAQARPRRRAARARTDHDARPPRRPRATGETQSTTRAGCTPATSPHRRRRLRLDHRPQEGDVHQRRGQEHVARRTSRRDSTASRRPIGRAIVSATPGPITLPCSCSTPTPPLRFADDPEVRRVIGPLFFFFFFFFILFYPLGRSPRATERLARAEQVKRWTILPGPWPAGRRTRSPRRASPVGAP